MTASTDTASAQAIGTTALVRVADPADLDTAWELLVAELARIDRIASNYRTDSELSALNAAAGTMLAVSDGLLTAVTAALGAAAATDGLVDPTLGHWGEVEIGPWAIKLPAGASLDLGATGKALAADRAAATIGSVCAGRGVLVSLGGDIATAGTAPHGGWAIHVTDDHRSNATAEGQTVHITSGALATSGTTVRRSADGRGHHIIDPRTGAPADSPWRTVSVTAQSCVDANTASTAAIILGHDAVGWLDSHGLAARLVAQDGTVTTTGGWPA